MDKPRKGAYYYFICASTEEEGSPGFCFNILYNDYIHN
jgi:hypothetical protein